ncbi:MAG: hypothetical protein CMM89_07330 [Rickettsiales bacterium]|nr:hypothetical protein [Rickettsiales bacterium]
MFGLIGCSGSAKRSASPFFLENIAKFDGKFSVYISDKKLINNSKIESQDCESWQIEIELDKAYRESLNNIIHRMFNNVEFTDKELNEDELAASEIIAQIVFKNHQANAIFKVKDNTANYNITIKTDLNVKSHMRSINNSVSSNKSWDRNLYLNCTANEGAYKSIQGSIENLMKEIHEKIYISLSSIKK